MTSLRDKRLVIFGCGYVGSALARAAVAAGARVTALTRNPLKAEVLYKIGVAHVVIADLDGSEWHDQIPKGPELVVNCVSSGGGATGYQQSYVDGMSSILQWASTGPQAIGSMLYTSSTSVYPQGGGAIVDETMPAEGATPNGRIIRESETLLQKAPPNVCGRSYILRLAGIYGPTRHHLLNQLREGATTLGGSGAHRLNLIHRDDIVSAALTCLTAPATVGSDIFNVADLAPAMRSEVVAWLSGRLGCATPTFDGIAGVRRGGEPMPDRLISSRKIQQTLGWTPRYPDYRAGYEQIFATE